MRAAAQVLRTLVKDGKDPDIIEDIFDKKGTLSSCNHVFQIHLLLTR